MSHNGQFSLLYLWVSRPPGGAWAPLEAPATVIDTFKGPLKPSEPMASGSAALRDDLELVMTTLDRAPHTAKELAEGTGIPDTHLEPRIDTLLDRGYISRWTGGDEPVLALTWRGRYLLHRDRFQAAALASLGVGLAAAAGLAWWIAAGTPPAPVARTARPGGAAEKAVALAVAALVSLVAAAGIRRGAPD